MIYRPEVFRLADSSDRRAYEQLRANLGARLLVYDAFGTQVADLIKTRNAAVKYSAEGLQAAVQGYCDSRRSDECGAWFYYPWSNRLVHLLDEGDFAELRTNRNRFKILPEEQSELSRKRVGIVGLSVGQHIALAMALERSFGHVRLADFDTLDLSNLNRVRCGTHDLGLPKAIITAREIAELDPYLGTECFLVGVTEQNVDEFLLGRDRQSPVDVIVDECDDLSIKVLLRHKARQYRIPVVMDTSDRGMLDVERFDLDPERPILHGLIEDIPYHKLRGLSTEEKIPFVVKILGGLDRSSPRMIASLIEVGQTLSTWPQLAADVVLGGAVASETVRRIHLGQFCASGRFFVCPSELIADSPGASDANNATGVSGDAMNCATAAEPVSHSTEKPIEACSSMARHFGERQQLRAIIEASALAPSGGNAQPWRWKVEGNRLLLYLDSERSSPSALLDYRQLASYAALGACLETAVLAAHRMGLSTEVTEFPERTKAIAALRLHAQGSDLETEGRDFDTLADSIEARCTSRKSVPRRPMPAGLAAELGRSVAHRNAARIELVEDPASLNALASVLGEADRIRFLNRGLHAELMSEVRFTGEEAERTRDGIDLRGLDLSPSDRAGFLLCRSWPAMQLVGKVRGGRALEKPSRRALETASAAALITVRDRSPQAYFRGGRAMQRAWLTATRFGLNVAPLSALPYFFARLAESAVQIFRPEDVSDLRRLRQEYLRIFNVRDLDGEVFLFVLNYASPPSVRALRRSVEMITDFE